MAAGLWLKWQLAQRRRQMQEAITATAELGRFVGIGWMRLR